MKNLTIKEASGKIEVDLLLSKGIGVVDHYNKVEYCWEQKDTPISIECEWDGDKLEVIDFWIDGSMYYIEDLSQTS